MILNTRIAKFTVINYFFRNCHSTNEIRVRFAPSPTGYLHLGGLRTALYNYLFAKNYNGSFILRIEDTDQNRLVKGATEALIEDLHWCGLQINEGPFIGGNYGPYMQSERLSLYRKEVKKLLENGTAYYCFCSEKRLELLRKDAVRNRQIAKYDNKCRHLTPKQVAENLAKNLPFCIRFKLKSFTDPFKDMVYGEISYNIADNECDPIILKSDGFPTYHLANVVDDHHMKISHVFRGVEWQISTVKHLLLYKAFGWKPPKFGHLPLLINSDGKKLSKRQGDIRICQYRDNGILPIALINYLSIAGGGFTKPVNKPQSYSLSDLAKQFDITKVNSHPSKLNPDLLLDFNRLEIIRLLNDRNTKDQIINEVKGIIEQKYVDTKANLDLDPNHIEKVLNWASNRLTKLQDLVKENFAFLWVRPSNDIEIDLKKELLSQLIDNLKQIPFEKQLIYNELKHFSDENQIQFPKLMTFLRSSLTGLKEGPGVAEMMEILGKQTTIDRISRFIEIR